MRKLTFWALCALCFTIPWENVLMIAGIGTISRTIGLCAIVLACLTVCSRPAVRPPSPIVLCFAAFVLWSAATVLWTISIPLSLELLITYVQLATLVWMIWEFARERSQQHALMQMYVLGCYVAAVQTVLAYESGQQASYLRYAAPGTDSNELGLILTIGTLLAWYLAGVTRGRLGRAINYAYPLMAFIAIPLTGSRGAAAAAVVAYGYIVFTSVRRRRSIGIAVLMALTAAAFALMPLVPSSSIERIASTMNASSRGDWSGRLPIWQAGATVFCEHPLLGVGVGAFRESIVRKIGIRIAAHNTFLSVAVDGGLPSATLWLLLLVASARSALRMDAPQRQLWAFLMVTWVIGASTISWDYSKSTWLLFALIAAQAGDSDETEADPAIRGSGTIEVVPARGGAA
ncbi:MAG TPA: O-antigen ligase family protein [Armatimonadota bacterium]